MKKVNLKTNLYGRQKKASIGGNHYTVRRTPLSEQCVSIAKNQYDHLKYIKVSDSYDSKFNCNVDILIGEYYYWDFVSGNIRRENSDSVAVENILGWVLSGT